MMRPQLLLRGAAVAALLALPACGSKTNASHLDAARNATAPPPASVTQAQVRDAIAQRDLSVAADLADKLTAEQPHDAGAWLLDAQAQAQLENAGNAARAFRKATELGLADPALAARNVLFDPVRDDPAFRAVVVRTVAPPSHSRRAASAGDVEIGADGSVRAGDISISGDR